MFSPNDQAANDAFKDFLPQAGRAYATRRNYDFGPDQRDNVSMLSPWIHLRMLPEWVVLKAVLESHSQSEAGKFIDEVCWHTYSKGWLQQHPEVWDNYLAAIENLRPEFADHLGYNKAIQGQTGIDCFDAWSQELVQQGYLHNHARMWFASIWVHTLKLPWELGAAFFLEHLYDGDAAANTLGWRWVSGLHTRGKAYLARRDNIKKYTDGRCDPSTPLAEEPIDFGDDYANPAKTAIPELKELPKDGRIGLLLHESDLSAPDWIADQCAIDAHCALFPESRCKAMGICTRVIDFRKEAIRASLSDRDPLFSQTSEVVAWAQDQKLDWVVLAEPPIGYVRPLVPKLKSQLEAVDIGLRFARHWWDEHFFPKAGAGFFKLKKAIPKALEQL